MDKNKDKNKEKTPAIETFPTDETPTPTKILRMADMDPFFSDLKENPFDLHFRKATEAVKQGADIANNKGVVARRLKDKLKILKEKLAEDENTLSDIKSGNLK